MKLTASQQRVVDHLRTREDRSSWMGNGFAPRWNVIPAVTAYALARQGHGTVLGGYFTLKEDATTAK